MRKPLAVRILALAAIYCAVFVFLVVLQFSKKGNFTLSIDAMTIRGRYSQQSEQLADAEKQPLADGVRVFFGGLEFNLKEDSGKGLLISGTDGSSRAAAPNYMTLTENSVRFELPGGTIIIFSLLSSSRGTELQTSIELAENDSGVSIPIEPRRASLVQDNGQLGILFNGERYMFTRSDKELETGRLILSSDNTVISYRSRGKQKAFDPADYVIAQAQKPQDYENFLNKWREQSFTYWNQNAASLKDENDVTAYCNEALRQGRYRAAIDSIPRDFLNDPRRGFKSSAYTGGMATAFRAFIAAEREKSSLMTRLLSEGSIEIFREEHIIDYLLARNNAVYASNVMSLLHNIDSEKIIIDHCPGLLETYHDFNRWNIQSANPVNQFIDQILLLISENIQRNAEKDLVYVSHSESIDLKFSMRLGKALLYWAEDAKNTEWAAIGRSLVMSSLNGEGIGSGKLYPIIVPDNYYPRAAQLGAVNLWAWTASQSIRASYQERDINISVNFLEGMTHHLMIAGVRPFIKIQIHNTDYRSDPQFERYDSSGWVYYPQEQVLVIKLRHRTPAENIKIIYTVVIPPPVVEETGENAATETAPRESTSES